jgi:hypothetical protein
MNENEGEGFSHFALLEPCSPNETVEKVCL